jgi:hypothetical protein
MLSEPATTASTKDAVSNAFATQAQPQNDTPEVKSDSKPDSTPTSDIHEDVVGNAVANTIHPSNKQPHTRIVAIALDPSDHASYAFNWAIENVVNPESDQLILMSKKSPTSPILLSKIPLMMYFSCMYFSKPFASL